MDRLIQSISARLAKDDDWVLACKNPCSASEIRAKLLADADWCKRMSSAHKLAKSPSDWTFDSWKTRISKTRKLLALGGL